ncbi:hypothetical protein [Zunongwangia sp.]|uniref:hypothetical protein n=1 Tax=Zunongwangia sp. TaxID=1965325 RepID=UPI003AA8A6D4
MNKKLLFLPVLLLGILFTACSDDDNVDDVVDRIRTIDDIPVSANASIDYLPINPLEIPIETDVNLRDALEDKTGTDETIDQVEDIELDDLSIELVSADEQENFDFVNSVTLGVRTDDLEYKEIAHLDEVPEGQTSIELETTEDYVDEYAKSESLKLVVKFESTDDANNLEVKLNMEFDAKLDPSL